MDLSIIDQFFVILAQGAHAFKNSPVNTPIALALMVAGYAYFKKREAQRRALSKSIFPGFNGVFSTTLYEPTGRINEKTGNPYYVQRIVTIHPDIDVGSIFHPAFRARAMAILRKASKLSERADTSPIVLKNIYDGNVVSHDEMCVMRERLSRRFKNFFSDVMDPQKHITKPLQANEVHIFKKYYIVLVSENIRVNQQLRILAVPEYLRQAGRFPDLQDVLFLDEDGAESDDPDHIQATRWHTNHIILEALDADQRLVQDTSLYVASGKTRFIGE